MPLSLFFLECLRNKKEERNGKKLYQSFVAMQGILGVLGRSVSLKKIMHIEL